MAIDMRLEALTMGERKLSFPINCKDVLSLPTVAPGL